MYLLAFLYLSVFLYQWQCLSRSQWGEELHTSLMEMIDSAGCLGLVIENQLNYRQYPDNYQTLHQLYAHTRDPN